MTSPDDASRHGFMAYRPDIDGLRAVSVLSVLLFHGGFPGFHGGYLGVDIFFVISGYLITRQILTEATQGGFSIARFYERRARRILPALVVVLAASACVAPFVLIRGDEVEFWASVVAVALSGANLYYWWISGYFDTAAQLKPLLHTWSLGVEEQFYIVLPLAVLIFGVSARAFRRSVVWLSIASLVLSIAVSLLGSTSASFFLTPMRAWELLLGAHLAARVVFEPERQTRHAELLGYAGLAAIAAGILLLSEEANIAQIGSLLPTLGAYAVIRSSQNARSSAGAILSTPPLVYVGRISYSLYLWHWPVLAFARYYNVLPLDGLQVAALLALSFILAVLSYHYVELPFREKRLAPRRGQLFAASAAALVVLVAGAGVIPSLRKASAGPQAAQNLLGGLDTPRRDCAAQTVLSINCVIGADVPPTWALWGDSHAWMMMDVLSDVGVANGQSIRVLVQTACPPAPGVSVLSGRKAPIIAALSPLGLRTGEHGRCPGAAEEALARILADPALRNVVIMSRLTPFLSPDKSGSGLVIEMNNSQWSLRTASEKTALLTSSLGEAIRTLLRAGRRVIVVEPVPDPGGPVPLLLEVSRRRGVDVNLMGPTTSAYAGANKSFLGLLDTLRGMPGFVRIAPREVLCREGRCPLALDGRPLYADDNHLSAMGANLLRPEFERLFRSRN